MKMSIAKFDCNKIRFAIGKKCAQISRYFSLKIPNPQKKTYNKFNICVEWSFFVVARGMRDFYSSGDLVYACRIMTNIGFISQFVYSRPKLIDEHQ